jgi:hypothetical protein
MIQTLCTPRNSMDLASLIYKGNMHNLRIIISVKPKIMSNSQEVCFDMTRQYTQVGHKNINNFSYKNRQGSFCRNGQQFI